ncbi:peptidoglycan DD-metalloendopeptidase family protein [Paenibacillus sp. BSR1-1]|uniref:murein hydrolase activator EnvC family protein n=1 Tax=Paenibacillus sp. BSR1-1 TaxID=3020845 RepID=UPI0025B1FBB3|nr:peptidoglycan DD-metalloendopeptidase family protein [Paenibacillus sp. BSR1-1]MDN3019045.1 peptidoglycan DD-metalloendopeptidase family protein [Paenibacillus sp. BSR1-1]
MRKTLITLATVAAVGIGTIFAGVPAKTSAESISKLKGDQNKIQEQRSDVKSGINASNDKISNLQSQQADVKDEMKRLDYAITDATNKINNETAKIEKTKVEITKLEEETKVLKDRIKKRNVLLKDRARSYQENGGMVNYLDVLMGSESFSDFIDRANAVATIMQADRDILKQHEADKKELETKQAQVEKDLASLQAMVANLEQLNKQLAAQKAEKDKLLASLVEQEQEEHDHVMDLKEQEEILAAQEAAVQKAIQLEQEKQAQAAARAAANKNNSSSSSSSSSLSSGGGASSGAVPGVSSGYWTQPAVGTFTSGFGGRGSEFHYGVDIANRTQVPIVAAADGVVIRSYLSSSYGNCIFVSHSINGQVYTTVYAHMSSRMVGNGAVVKKGQQIGVMGNTGDSTGQHLHFELHKGPWTQDKRNAINPVGIVPLP